MQRPQFMNFGTILESQEVERQVLPDRLPDSDSIWSRQDDGTAKTLSDGESEGHQVDKTLMEIEEEIGERTRAGNGDREGHGEAI